MISSRVSSSHLLSLHISKNISPDFLNEMNYIETRNKCNRSTSIQGHSGPRLWKLILNKHLFNSYRMDIFDNFYQLLTALAVFASKIWRSLHHCSKWSNDLKWMFWMVLFNTSQMFLFTCVSKSETSRKGAKLVKTTFQVGAAWARPKSNQILTCNFWGLWSLSTF